VSRQDREERIQQIRSWSTNLDDPPRCSYLRREAEKKMIVDSTPYQARAA
jgi:hypothetical protein